MVTSMSSGKAQFAARVSALMQLPTPRVSALFSRALLLLAQAAGLTHAGGNPPATVGAGGSQRASLPPLAVAEPGMIGGFFLARLRLGRLRGACRSGTSLRV